ncbi:MAG: hypothetical protein K8E24_015930, partial [Methanobacterium paludis]|nr:hypothetical protein [Methanobacterium paludis]
RIFREDPERVLTYNRQDIIETARLAEMLAPTDFYQTQMAPENFGAVAISGTGERINSLFIRYYLSHGRAIPRPQRARPHAGGYTDVRATGVLDRVVKADVESLYPSVMLSQDIHPASDSLGVFLPALRELTRRRLEAKARARETQGTEQFYWSRLQGSFKVLINSFYGYLGAPTFHFNDYRAAGRVTEIGRTLVQQIASDLQSTGSQVIEIDTDGVYFVPPATVMGEAAERAYVDEMGARLPAGIHLAFDGRYKAMVSLKTKNYVLYDYDGNTIFRGASLRSRADEAYGREFLSQTIGLVLEHRLDDVRALYERTIADILNHRIPIDRLARRERVTEKTFTSVGKRRAARAAHDATIGDHVIVYERRDGALARVEEHVSGDENTAYYMQKLYRFASRLREAIGERFDLLIVKPTAQGLPHAGQQVLDLFDD